jgi:hypothetical protein
MNADDFPGDGETPQGGTKPVSARKVEANRRNAQRSTGPRTVQGKANSARNSLVHGFFARKLFNSGQGTEERRQYEELGACLKDHYQPIGFVEELLVEQIFAELVRQSCLLRYEQQAFSNGQAFLAAADKILRYQSTQNRHLAQLMKELERLQEKRQGSGQSEPSGPDCDYPPAESVDPVPELVAEEPLAGDEVHASREASEDGTDSGRTPGEGPSSNPSLTENCETNPPPISGGGSKDGENGSH